MVTQVLKVLDDPSASPRTIERLVEQDPALSAKILRVSSSAYFAASPVTSLARAISLLGIQRVRSLVIAVAYQQVIAGKANSLQFDRALFWSHSLATGTAAWVVARLAKPELADEMYCAGMLHDVGLLVLEKFIAQDLDASVRMAKASEIPLHEAEQRTMQYDHAAIGGMLADKWGLSPAMRNAIRHHHDPFSSEDETAPTIIALANALAYAAGYPNQVPFYDESSLVLLAGMLNLPEAQLESIKAAVANEVKRAEEAFGLTMGDSMKKKSA